MKKTYPTNVNGQIFYIDEDAFELLQNYLNQLKNTFSGNGDEEIVDDIESRISEHFADRLRGGASVIVLADVEKVIETMGRPEDICDDSSDNETAKSDTAENMAEDTHDEKKNASKSWTFHLPQKKLYRNMKDKVFGGVLGGLAVYLGWNANIMRALLIVLALFSKVFPLIIIYLIAWMIIPPAKTPRQVLQMKGMPVNVDTVGQTVMAESPTTPPDIESGNIFSNLLSVAGKCIMAFLGIIFGMCTVICLIGFLTLLIGTIAYFTTSDPFIFQDFDILPIETGWSIIAAIMAAILLGSIISGLITWGCAATLFPLPKVSKPLIITLTMAAIILAAIAAIFIIFANIG